MQTIEINTTQNVIIRYELGTLRDRIMAFFIDSIIIWSIVLVSSGIFVGIFGSAAYDYFMFIFLFPFFFFYSLVSEILNEGQSWGKKALKIKVVKLNGKEPLKMDYVLRWVFRMVDIYLSLGTLAAIFVGSSSKGQRIGDIVAHTTVIKIKPDLNIDLKELLNIKSIENYQPKYPDIKKFSEENMILVKTMIEVYKNHPNKANQEAMNELLAFIKNELGLKEIPKDKIEFMRTLIKDYIVLTR